MTASALVCPSGRSRQASAQRSPPRNLSCLPPPRRPSVASLYLEHAAQHFLKNNYLRLRWDLLAEQRLWLWGCSSLWRVGCRH